MQLAAKSISRPPATDIIQAAPQPAEIQQAQPFRLSSLSAKQRRELAQREQILAEWEQAKAAALKMGMSKDKATDMFLLSVQDRLGKPISRGTLYNWARAARSGRDNLVDGRVGRNQPIDSRFFPFLEAWKNLWLRQSQPKAAACYDYTRIMAEREGWPIPSLKTVDRFRRAIDPRVVIRYRFGPAAFNDKVLPFMERDYTTLDSNTLWCSDHMQFDVICNAGSLEKPRLCRPWLTSWQDARSRKIVGHRIYASDPNATQILLAFRAGCLSAGVPDHCYTDNGKDYDSYIFTGATKRERRAGTTRAAIEPARAGWSESDGVKWDVVKVRPALNEQQIGIYGALGVELHHAKPYNAQAKMIESWHRTVHDRFDRFLPTYCGPTTDQKPENLSDQIARGAAPLLADFIAMFDAWLEGDYHLNHDHSGQGMDGQTPAVVFAANLKSKRTAPAETLELLIQRTSRPLKVGRQGVNFDGRSYGAGSDVLSSWFGKDVYLRVGDDVGIASVWTIDDRFIGMVRLNGLSPFLTATDEQYRQAERRKKAVRASVAAAADLRPRRGLSVSDHLLLTAAESAADAAKNPDPFPDTVKMVQTPLTDQLPALRRAMRAAPVDSASTIAALPALPDLSAFSANTDLPIGDEEDSSDAFRRLAQSMRRDDGED